MSVDLDMPWLSVESKEESEECLAKIKDIYHMILLNLLTGFVNSEFLKCIVLHNRNLSMDIMKITKLEIMSELVDGVDISEEILEIMGLSK